uniref:DUF38 domain-containing protein n=1 Tax=Panagrolaimus sp. ES5 TaxID=591445 RepID=A0AC34FVQ0_9BILA
MVASILPKFYRINVKNINIFNQHIYLDEFLFLTTNVRRIHFYHTVVKNEDGTIVPFEKLIKLLPRVENIEVSNKSEFLCITTETVKELLELPHFSKIIEFDLSDICELFDIKTFFAYMKKNPSTKFSLYFNPVSEAFKIRLEEIIADIIESKTRGIDLNFIGLDRQKHLKIRKLYHRSR